MSQICSPFVYRTISNGIAKENFLVVPSEADQLIAPIATRPNEMAGDGERILKHHLNLTESYWRHWLQLLKLYLMIEEWFINSNLKEEAQKSGLALSSVLTNLHLYFPWQHDSHALATAHIYKFLTVLNCGATFQPNPPSPSPPSMFVICHTTCFNMRCVLGVMVKPSLTARQQQH